MPSTKGRAFCLTFFTEPIKEIPETVRYAVFGKEIAPTTKKIHWQAYAEFDKQLRFGAVKKLFKDKTIHIEVRHGTREEARDYCKKEGDWYEHGVWIKGPGARRDLEAIVQVMKDGASITEVMMTHSSAYCRHRNGLRDIAAEITRQKASKWRTVEVIFHTGPTGCGKTRAAMEVATYKIQADQTDWWQDYQGEEAICIDEYNNDMKISRLLQYLDGYECRLPVKGSHTYAMWTKVFITSNLRWEEIHPNAKMVHKKALRRRITMILNDWPEAKAESDEYVVNKGTFFFQD